MAKVTKKKPAKANSGVSKYRSYYQAAMVRPTCQELIAIEKVAFSTHRSQEEGAHHTVGGGVCIGKRQGWLGGRRQRGTMAKPLLWFLREGPGKAGIRLRSG